MTTTRSLGAAAVAAALLCAAPAAAQAATIAPDKPCYGGFDALVIRGVGFTPNSPNIAFVRNGKPVPQSSAVPADAAGKTLAAGIVVPTSKAKAIDTYVATDTANPLITATTRVRRTRVGIKLSGLSRRSVTAPIRVKAAGLTSGKTLYAHIVRGRTRTLRIGKLKGGCHTGSYRRSFFKSSAPVGRYNVQFDTRQKYSRKTLQRVLYPVRVYRYLVRRPPASAAGTSGQLRAEWGRPVTR